MKIKVTIIEDQPIEAERLKKELEAWSKDTSCSIEISEYASGEEFFTQVSVCNADVYFLDIQLGGITGIKIAKRLREKNFSGHIIFLTAFREYVFKGYEVHALNYLLKPITAKALVPCMNEISKDFSGNTYIFRMKQGIVQIPYKEILTFSSNLHYVDILTVNETFCQYTSLNSIIGYLPKEFVRTHKSYIVNMNHIYRITGNTITLSNNMHIQIGRSFYKDVSRAFSEYSTRLN